MQLLTEAELTRRVVAFTRQAIAAGIVSQRELARRMRYSQGYLSLVLAGGREPSPELVDSLIVCLGIHLPDLFTVVEMRELSSDHVSLLEAAAAVAA